MHPRLVRLLFENRRFLKPLLPVRGRILRRLPEFALYVRLDDWAVGARIALRAATSRMSSARRARARGRGNCLE